MARSRYAALRSPERCSSPSVSRVYERVHADPRTPLCAAGAAHCPTTARAAQRSTRCAAKSFLVAALLWGAACAYEAAPSEYEAQVQARLRTAMPTAQAERLGHGVRCRRRYRSSLIGHWTWPAAVSAAWQSALHR